MVYLGNMEMTDADSNKGRTLPQLITEAMTGLGLSIRELALRLEVTYEHTRKIVNGDQIPPPRLRKDIVRVLGLNPEHVEALAKAAKMRKTFGFVPDSMLTEDRELEALTRFWSTLTENRKRDLVAIARMWARGNV